MRLTKLKLAGFKSFVDPTIIALPGQLVGVVGPNGCGKSNVIDAVRWVLGESKASELRGESMQDVIFNGSGARKPVSRALVEMTFDNASGRIAGQWSNYSELSVKRLLTRNEQSEYYINNLHVRRKDITDLFLGTGLGPRAYAIIGQGTISRIIEARPDELRVFLEEAAGVTKYKERRKETESRLSDARDNLALVGVKLQELDSQMGRLEEQAEIARQWKALSDELKHKQQLLWLLRRNEARAECERYQRKIEQETLALEARITQLREIEARLASAQERQAEANDALTLANDEYRQAASEVAVLEEQIRHQEKSHREFESRLAQLHASRSAWQDDITRYDEDGVTWQRLLSDTQARVEQSEKALAEQRELLPVAELSYTKAQEDLAQKRAVIGETNQRLQVELTHCDHAQRVLLGLEKRRANLHQEYAALPVPDAAGFETRQQTLVHLRGQIDAAKENVISKKTALLDAERAWRDAHDALSDAQREQTEATAHRAALERLQKKVRDDGQMDAWLGKRRLDLREPLWKSIHVEPGWDDAVEAVLREKLSALSVEDADPAWSGERPGRRQAFALPADPVEARAGSAPTLRSKVRCDDEKFVGALSCWLADALIAPDLASALRLRETLTASAICVTPAGDIVDRHGLVLFAADSSAHGVLERQREIDELGKTIARLEARVEQERQSLLAAESCRETAKEMAQKSRDELEAFQEQEHAVQVETLKLSQALERFAERKSRIDAELVKIQEDEETEKENLARIEAALLAVRDRIAQLQHVLDAAKLRFDETDRGLRNARERVNEAERALQEARFSHRESRNKIDELSDRRQKACDALAKLGKEIAECSDKVEALRTEDLAPCLQEALDRRLKGEQTLAAARNEQDAEMQALKTLSEERMRIELELDPLRKQITDLTLKEQAASINAEQLNVQLNESGADEHALAVDLPAARAEALQRAQTALQRSIDTLGDVNLAAPAELETARATKENLDKQIADLTQAMNTLENAIQKIDRETRDLLRSTYDAANANFGVLFPELFGGGEARLTLTGEEILDAGVQVTAQPPGKKNSTIHLLSGGEKALTAIALVFALFQLNPAPFCLLDEVDAPLDDTNTERFCEMVRRMSEKTQFLFISHNKIAMEMAQQLVGVTMQESGVSRIVEVDMEEALRLREQIV